VSLPTRGLGSWWMLVRGLNEDTVFTLITVSLVNTYAAQGALILQAFPPTLRAACNQSPIGQQSCATVLADDAWAPIITPISPQTTMTITSTETRTRHGFDV